MGLISAREADCCDSAMSQTLSLSFSISMFQSRAGHPLTKATGLDKILFQAADLLIEQVVRLMNEAERDIGYNFRRASLHKFPVGLIGLGSLCAEAPDVAGFL